MNITGKGLKPIQKGEVRNPTGMRKGMKERYNNLRERILDLMDSNKKGIEDYCRNNPGELLKEGIRILPKEFEDIGNPKDRIILIREINAGDKTKAISG